MTRLAQQANTDTSFAALLVRRRGHRGRPASWVAVMELDQLATLLQEATDG